MRELVKLYHPEAASIETAFAARNIRTAMILSLARGAVITALTEEQIPVYEYSPKTAKRAATGIGEAQKQQVAAVFAALASLDISKIPDDATDALALAFCHASLVVRNNSTCRVPSPI
jgi:crossover junction endodeoxyribonuclease RuvC